MTFSTNILRVPNLEQPALRNLPVGALNKFFGLVVIIGLHLGLVLLGMKHAVFTNH